MRRYIITIFIASGVLMIILSILQQINYEDTRVLVDKPIIDIGVLKVNSTEEAEAVFYLKNIGSRNLMVHRIEPDCYCTSYRLDLKEIKSSDSTRITLIFNKQTSGYFSHFAKVYCNSKDSPILLMFKGKIENDTIIELRDVSKK